MAIFSQPEIVRGPVGGARKNGRSEGMARRADGEHRPLWVCFVRLFTACGIRASWVAAVFSRKDKTEVERRGGVSPPLSRPATVLSFDFWFGMGAS